GIRGRADVRASSQAAFGPVRSAYGNHQPGASGDTMRGGLRAATGAVIYAATIGLSAAQTAAAQNPPQASTARNFVAIGCISQEAPGATAARGGAATRPTFILTDMRATPP